MKDLGIDLSFSTETIDWEGHAIPFRSIDNLKNFQESYYIPDPGMLDEAAEHLKKILDAKYEAADLEVIAKEASHLESNEQQMLLELLEKHSTLFNGTLGKWENDPCEIKLKPDAKPCHAHSYPVPKVHKATLRQEVKCLCELGVFKIGESF